MSTASTPQPDHIEALLRARPRARVRLPGRAAAVLVPLWERPPVVTGAGASGAGATLDDALRVTLIKRTEKVRHPGQYAFPGGSRDEGDADAVATALREAHEELGIEPDRVRVLGMLHDRPTLTGFIVTPVVGWIPADYPFTPEPYEVAAVVDLPARAFTEAMRVRPMRLLDHRRLAHSYEVQGHFIWGATARILSDLGAVLAAPASTAALATKEGA